MLSAPSDKATSVLRYLQSHGLDSNIKNDSPMAVKPEALDGWCPPITLSESDLNRIKQQSVDRINALLGKMPTELEDPTCYLLYREVLERLERACNVLELRVPQRLCFGTMASTKLNARAIQIDKETDECLIIISRQFVPFCYQCAGFLAKIVASELERSADEEDRFTKSRVSTEDEQYLLYRVIADLTNHLHKPRDENGEVCELRVDRTLRRPRMAVEGTAAVIRSVVTDAMEHFMVGHELSHFVLAPLTDQEAIRMEKTSLDAAKQRYSEEHACDTYGHLLSTHATAEAYRNLPPAIWFVFAQLSGPIFLAFLQLIEQAAHMVRTGTELPENVPSFEQGSTVPEEIGSHPTTALRKFYLFHQLKKRGELEGHEYMKQVLKAGEWIDGYMDTCWDGMREHFLRLHNEYSAFTSLRRG